IEQDAIRALAVDPSEPRRVFALGGATMYRSGDSGAHWAKLQGFDEAASHLGPHTALAALGDVLLVGLADGIARSTDHGESWRIDIFAPQPGYNGYAFRFIAADPVSGRIHAVASQQNFISTDRGQTWSPRPQPFADAGSDLVAWAM